MRVRHSSLSRICDSYRLKRQEILRPVAKLICRRFEPSRREVTNCRPLAPITLSFPQLGLTFYKVGDIKVHAVEHRSCWLESGPGEHSGWSVFAGADRSKRPAGQCTSPKPIRSRRHTSK